MAATKAYEFNLFENARDSLLHAVEHISTEDVDSIGNMKRAILDVFHALELLLKERLYQINPALVYRNIDSQDLKSSKTVSMEEAINRLSNLENVPLLRSMRNTLIRCKEMRNDIIHYKFQIKTDEAKAILGKTLSLVFTFSKNILNQDLETELRNTEQWLVLVSMADFWKEHKEKLEEELISKGIKVTTCPYCEAHTFDPSKNTCALCGHNDTQIHCHYCNKIIWCGKAKHIDEIDTEGGHDYFGLPNTKEVSVCNSCWNERMAEDYWEWQAELERGK